MGKVPGDIGRGQDPADARPCDSPKNRRNGHVKDVVRVDALTAGFNVCGRDADGNRRSYRYAVPAYGETTESESYGVHLRLLRHVRCRACDDYTAKSDVDYSGAVKQHRGHPDALR